MKNYLIRLQLQIGEQQKHTYHAIQAENKEAAFLQALQDESHGDSGYENYCHDKYDADQEWWDCGEMIYSVSDYRELTDHEFETYNTVTNVLGTSPKYPEKYTAVDVAEQQLLGFKTAQGGDSIIDLVDAMGLTTDELEIIIKKYPSTLSDEDITSIRKHLMPLARDFRIQQCEAIPNVVRVHDYELWEQLLTNRSLVSITLGIVTGDKIACLSHRRNTEVGMWEECGDDETGVGYIAISNKAYNYWSAHANTELWVEMSHPQVTNCKYINAEAAEKVILNG